MDMLTDSVAGSKLLGVGVCSFLAEEPCSCFGEVLADTRLAIRWLVALLAISVVLQLLTCTCVVVA